MKQDIENIIKKNLPEKKLPPHSDDEFIKIAKENGITITSENLSDIVKNMMLSMDNARFWEYRQGFNDCILNIPVSIIADEVLKVVVEKIREMVENLSDEYDRGYDEKTSQPALLNKLLQELSNLSHKENKNNE